MEQKYENEIEINVKKNKIGQVLGKIKCKMKNQKSKSKLNKIK